MAQMLYVGASVDILLFYLYIDTKAEYKVDALIIFGSDCTLLP